MSYKRILLKLSGEALMGDQQYGIDPSRLQTYAKDIKTALNSGVEIALVIGGFAAGLINVVAGNGSAITLPLLMWVGLDANAANATNRVGALFQTTSAISALSKTARTKYMMKQI